MNVRPTLEIEATITERGQTTVPAAIRRMLGVKKGPIVFKGLSDGTVIIEARRQEDEEDPLIAKFLEFLEKDIRSGKISMLIQPIISTRTINTATKTCGLILEPVLTTTSTNNTP